jgi:hypothetical protein
MALLGCVAVFERRGLETQASSVARAEACSSRCRAMRNRCRTPLGLRRCAPALRRSAAATSGLRGLHAMVLVFMAIAVSGSLGSKQNGPVLAHPGPSAVSRLQLTRRRCLPGRATPPAPSRGAHDARRGAAAPWRMRWRRVSSCGSAVGVETGRQGCGSRFACAHDKDGLLFVKHPQAPSATAF